MTLNTLTHTLTLTHPLYTITYQHYHRTRERSNPTYSYYNFFRENKSTLIVCIARQLTRANRLFLESTTACYMFTLLKTHKHPLSAARRTFIEYRQIG